MDAFSLDIFKEIKEENCYNNDNGYVQLTKAYPEVFTDKIGCLKGCKIHLQINKEIKPTIQSYRRPPYHLAEATEKAIDELIQNDIIEPAPQLIRWLSQLASEGMKYEWTQKHEAAFEAIKSRLTTKA
jgi:hypothetical protein